MYPPETTRIRESSVHDSHAMSPSARASLAQPATLEQLPNSITAVNESPCPLVDVTLLSRLASSVFAGGLSLAPLVVFRRVVSFSVNTNTLV